MDIVPTEQRLEDLGPRPDLTSLRSPARVSAVERLVQQGPPGERVQELTSLAAAIVQAPCAQLSLLGGQEQVVAAVHGLELSPEQRRGPLADSLCSVTAASGQALLVSDAAEHPWVRHLPPVASGQVAAYLGVVLTSRDGDVLGSLCVYDDRPRSWHPHDVAALTALARTVAMELERLAQAAQSTSTSVRMELAAGAADLGSYEYDLRSGVLVWDERMMALHGYTPDTFSGAVDAFTAVAHPDDLPGVTAATERAVALMGDLVLDYRVVLPDRTHRWIRARGRVLPDMLGAPTRILGAAYDFSAERSLRDELTRLLETMPEAFLRCGRDWLLTYANAVAEVLTSKPRDELVGKSLWEVFPQIRGTAFEGEYQRARDTGESGVVEVYFEPLGSHFEVHIWPDDQGLSLFFHDVSERKNAAQALDRITDRLSLLAEAGPRLTASLQPREVLGVLAELVVPDLAHWLVLAVVDDVAEQLDVPGAGGDPSRLHLVQLAHQEPEGQALLEQVIARQSLRTSGSSGLSRAVRSGMMDDAGPLLDESLPDRAEEAADLEQRRLLDCGPVLSVPLRSPSGVLGALSVGSDRAPLDELLIGDLTARAAVALDNALAFVRQNRAATALQSALLPREAPGFPDILVATRYIPASIHALAGGDFFKTVRVDGRLVSMLGDVMGHGTASAARAGQLHSVVATLALEGHGPGALLERLAADVGQMMDLELATLLVCSYDPATRLLTSATAGHPPPLFAPVTGQPYYLELEPGAPIGVAATSYPEHTCPLPSGSTMVLFSDGLVERRDESISVGLERLRAAVNELRLPPEAVADHVLHELSRSAGGDDDVALLVLSHV